jgi:hypothetical protein
MTVGLALTQTASQADVYFGGGPATLKRREAIKRKTIEQ